MKTLKKNRYEVNIKKTMYVIIAFVIGFFIAIYLKSINHENVYISLEQKLELEEEISKARLNIINLKEMKKEYNKNLESYEVFSKDINKSVGELMESELKYLKEISGYSEISGSGVKIIIKDSERELTKGENPNDLIVHDIDILRILNDLKKAGAKGISINGERVLPTSQIKCSGATITINKTTYGQPFVIEAIGDEDVLMASINSPESYANLLREVYGIYINIDKDEQIMINFYKKNK